MAEVYGPVFALNPGPATFADRAGRSVQRQINTTLAQAEVARQQWQRRQATQKQEGQHAMKMPPITIPAPGWLGAPPANTMDHERQRHLLSATALGRAALRHEEAHKPAQFAEPAPLSEGTRHLLNATHRGRQALAERDRQAPASTLALFAEDTDQGAHLRYLLAATHLGRQVLAERGLAG